MAEIRCGFRGTLESGSRRGSVVELCVVLPDIAGKADLPHLRSDRPHPPLALRSDLRGSRLRLNAAPSTVKADPPRVIVIATVVVDHHRAVVHNDGSIDIGIVNIGGVHIGEGCVVVESISPPATAPIAVTVIAVAVVHAAVESNFRTPVTGVPGISGVAPSPIARSPVETRLRSFHPRAGYPVISVASPSPISRGPDVARSRTLGLLVNGQLGRCDGDGHGELRKGGARQSRKRTDQGENSKPAKSFHATSFYLPEGRPLAPKRGGHYSVRIIGSSLLPFGCSSSPKSFNESKAGCTSSERHLFPMRLLRL